MTTNHEEVPIVVSKSSKEDESLEKREPTRVLLVEDDADCAVVIRTMLEARTGDGRGASQESKCVNGDWVVTVAHTMLGALEILEDNGFDLALVDLSLPDAPNGEIVTCIHEYRKNLPIVIQSGNDDWKVINKYVPLDGTPGLAVDFIIKGDPISAETLKHRLCRDIYCYQASHAVDFSAGLDTNE